MSRLYMRVDYSTDEILAKIKAVQEKVAELEREIRELDDLCKTVECIKEK